MSLLSVTVKKAHYVGAQAAAQFNSYVTLKLQNVKSTTVTVKGASPCWEQDFLFETNDLNTGLLIEVWSKGMIWDRAMGYHWLPLHGIPYTTSQEEAAKWLSLDAELVMRDGEVVGTKNPTGNSLLVECRFELPFGRFDPPTGWRSLLSGTTPGCRSNDAKTNASIDPENIEASDLQKKLELLNNIMDPEARAEQARRQMQYFGHSGYSEDSDYTSDLNYPVGQHANSSASQFRSAAHQMHTPQRSLETSRENSYERDDGVVHHYLPQPPTHQHHLSPGTHRQRHMQQRYSPNADDYGYGSPNVGNNRTFPENNIDSEPLFYNSRPRNKSEYTSQEWGSHDTYYSAQQSFDAVDSCNDYNTDQSSRKTKALRRPSLERQTTLYDDYTDINTYTTNQLNEISYVNTSGKQFNQNTDDYYNTSSYPFQEERYGQDEEDRQWDSGGYYPNKSAAVVGAGKKLLPTLPTSTTKRRASVINTDDNYDITNFSSAPTPTPGRRKCLPQIPTAAAATKRSSSRQSSINEDYDGYRTPTEMTHRGASLPPTPTKTPKVMTRLMVQNKPFNSLPPTPGRQLPKPNLNNRNSAKARRANLMKRTSSAEYSENNDIYDSYYMRPGAMSARDNYNEDYNYAYQSIDNLPAQPEDLHQQSQHAEHATTTTSVRSSTALTTTVTTTSSQQQHYKYNNIQAQRYDQSDYYYDVQDDLLSNSQQTDYYQNDANTKNTEQYTNLNYQKQQPVVTSAMTTATAAASVTKAASSFYEEQSSKLKLFGNRLKTSLLSQQNIDSLDAHDEELKHSFDTAISSIESSIANQYPEYSTPGLDTNTISSSAFYDAAPTSAVQTTIAQYHRDQNDSPKAIVATNGGSNLNANIMHVANGGTTTPTTTHTTMAAATMKLNGYSRGYLQQQDTIDSSGWQQDDLLYNNEKETYYEEDENYLMDEETTPINGDYNTKAITNQESPASVIHVDLDEQSLRRGSSQLTVVDPYHSQKTNDYPSRRPSVMDPYAVAASNGGPPPTTTATTTMDNQHGSISESGAYEDEYVSTPPRKPSVADSYQNANAAPRTIAGELERQDTTEVLSPGEQVVGGDGAPPEEKRVSFEEDEDQKPSQRPQVTAQQRWHWAYNKIIMQLNVSFYISLISYFVWFTLR